MGCLLGKVLTFMLMLRPWLPLIHIWVSLLIWVRTLSPSHVCPGLLPVPLEFLGQHIPSVFKYYGKLCTSQDLFFQLFRDLLLIQPFIGILLWFFCGTNLCLLDLYLEFIEFILQLVGKCFHIQWDLLGVVLKLLW